MEVKMGKVVITRGASQLPDEEIQTALKRHSVGDWGIISDEDKETNNSSSENNDGMILSVYVSKTGKSFWIITDSGGETTTILLPEEY